MTIITDERCTSYHSPGHPERPSRVSGTVKQLKAQTGLNLEWIKPEPALKVKVLRAHTTNHFQRLAMPHDFDSDTPNHAGIRDHALRSVGGALKALELAKAGKPNFSLLRPPGHHATREHAMGFCYLGSVAIATLEAKAGDSRKVAVFDFDVHHGNGTEEILTRKNGIEFFSIHQHPAYPGSGTKSFDNCHNYTAQPNLPREDYRKIGERALADLKAYDPDLVIVSAGFDAYAGDPLCNQKLSAEDFRWFGKTLASLGVPVASAMEGGYSDDLPDLVLSYLHGLLGK
ncbi:MAG TPA: histone deacetylase [Verrucomicrobiota bacterium]|nr:histone deacetylase [Verrucomicrobiota bacterium]